MTRMIPLLWSVAFIALTCFFVWAMTPSAHAQNVTYASPLTEKPLDLKRIASAIKAVENTPRHFVSPTFARSEYQIVPDVWLQHSKFPVDWGSGDDAVCVNETLKVVHKHLEWIVRQLTKNGYTVSPTAIGMVWHGGWGRWYRYEMRTEDTNYGIRVGNCYEETAK